MAEFQLSPGDPLSSEELHRLVTDFRNQNKLKILEIKSLSDTVMIIQAVKKINQPENDRMFTEWRKTMISEIKKLYSPFAAARVIHVHLSCIGEQK